MKRRSFLKRVVAACAGLVTAVKAAGEPPAKLIQTGGTCRWEPPAKLIQTGGTCRWEPAPNEAEMVRSMDEMWNKIELTDQERADLWWTIPEARRHVIVTKAFS